MKRLLLETSFSKIYMIAMIIITLLVVGGYFSYAMFTVSKEKSNAISIVTGNLTYELLIDGEKRNDIIVPANKTTEFTVTLNNPNNRKARFNFYYEGSLPDGVSAGYIIEENSNIPPVEAGINLEKEGTSGSSNTYIIKTNNVSSTDKIIFIGVEVGLDYNDLSLPNNGHLFEEYSVPLANLLLIDNTNNINKSDNEQYFITGENPNNYIWYSGKLWRAVSIDPSDNSVKIVTEWNISAIPYDDNSSNFDGSYMKDWLNDTSVDGFLGNLRDYESFIKLDSKWNATQTTSTTKPNKTTLVSAPVGLLNIYEYTMSYSNNTKYTGYINNGLQWWTLTPYSNDKVWCDGTVYNYEEAHGVRPSINLKSNVKVASGVGTEENPYRLVGDNDVNLSGTKLNTRYSGEYIKFGTEENNLYRIVSHETKGLTKITSMDPLKEGNTFINISFGNNDTFSSTNTIGTFLNGEYLTNYVGNNYTNMIEENTIWYLGTVGSGASYKLAKYTDIDMINTTESTTNAKIGLLRLGELMSGQFNKFTINSVITGYTSTYWLLTKYESGIVRVTNEDGNVHRFSYSTKSSIKPAFNLKANVIITGGDGTKNNPFTIALN